MDKGCCFECGNHFQRTAGGAAIFVERDYHGTTVKMHKDCAARYDKANDTPTPHEGRAFSTDDREQAKDFSLEPDTELDFEESRHVD